MAISLFQRVHPEIAVALDVTDEQPVTGLPSWTTIKPSLRPCSISLIPSMKTAPARLEEKYLGHGDDFDYVDTRTFLRAVDSVLPDLQPLFEKYARRLTGSCWRQFPTVNRTGMLRPPPHGRARVDDAHQNTAQSLGISDRTDAEQSISGGAQYLQDMMAKVPETVPEGSGSGLR